MLHSPFAMPFPPAAPGSAEKICAILQRIFPGQPLRRPRVRRATSSSEDSDVSDKCMQDGEESLNPDRTIDAQLDGYQNLSFDGKTSEFNGNKRSTQGGSGEAEHSLEETHPVPNALVQEDHANCAPGYKNLLHNPRKIWLGVNEVTKALEKGVVSIVVVARDVSPPLLVAHLPVLCYIKQAEIIPVNGGGEDVAAVLGVSKLLAFAVGHPNSVEDPKSRDALLQLCNLLREHTCKLSYPWLEPARVPASVPQLPEPKMAPPSNLYAHI